MLMRFWQTMRCTPSTQKPVHYVPTRPFVPGDRGRSTSTHFSLLLLGTNMFNPMKLRAATTVMILTAFMAPAVAQDQQQPAAKSKGLVADASSTLHQKMLGEWVLSGEPGTEIEPKPGARMKFFGHSHWIITEHDPSTGVVIFHHGGTYELDGDSYTEKLTFANESTKHMIGLVFKFKIKVADGKFTQEGDGNPFTEVWTRPKK